MTGDFEDLARLGDIPLDDGPVLALVPFRQVVERGFDAHDDGTPLRILKVREREVLSGDEALDLLPSATPALTRGRFDIGDEEYARAVQRVIDEEIGRGEGANFVLHRSYVGEVSGSARAAVLSYFAALLRSEEGAYWTYAVDIGGVAFAGASPERHLTIRDGVVTMNPISGTYRHPPAGPDVPGMLTFLTDDKEVDELFMVVDEELKLMSAICPGGGHVIGPFLKPMSKVTHTEYLLEGRTELDAREVLRATMFAPTVTGAPMGNACRVIRRREGHGRGYYAGVMALFEARGGGVGVEDGVDLDAPILIRTAFVDPDGVVKVPVGATIVRNSNPLGEAAETAGKAAGLLSAMGAGVGGGSRLAGPAPTPPPRRGAGVGGEAGPGSDDGLTSVAARVAGDPQVEQTLRFRNERLSPFWFRDQAGAGVAVGGAPEVEVGVASSLAGVRVTVVDAEDGFSQMLAHQLRRLGAFAQVVGWGDAGASDDVDVLVAGPGPGDPDGSEPRVRALRDAIVRRIDVGAGLVCVCLSHQILCRHLGLNLRALARPHQGEQRTDLIFGMQATLGYYNTFTAVAPLTPLPGVEIARRAGSDEVIAVRGAGFASLQGHPESALSLNGIDVLRTVVRGVLR